MSLTDRIMQQWYRKNLTLFTASLLPLSLLFGAMVKIRRWLYASGFKKKSVFNIPVIVVGNLTVGGTGKTPMVIWLAEYYRSRGFRPGIVARGVGGRKIRQPLHVSAESRPCDVGDEAVLLARRTNCPVVVAIDRVAAVNTLLRETDCNLIISDDGLQHYRMGRTLEIILIDGIRELGNRALLPAGPLRESAARLKEADAVFVNGKDFTLKGETLTAVNNLARIRPASDFSAQKIHAIAGIGHPDQFFAQLRALGMEVIPHVFPNHYLFEKKDLYFNDGLPVLMTEKDAVKCQSFAGDECWYLPVTVFASEKILSDLNCHSPLAG